MKTIIILSLALSTANLFGQTILVDEDFEGATFPAGWTQTSNATDGGWLMGNNNSLQSQWWSIGAHGNFIASNDDACDCDKALDYLIMPPLDLSTLTSPVLQFESYFDAGSLSGGTEVATVEYSLDNGITWNLLQTIVGTDDGAWDAQTVNLNSISGNANVLVAFHYFDDNNWLFGWGVDDVLVFELEGTDLELSALLMNATVDVQSSNMVAGSVTNTGLNTIQSFDASWTIGTTVYTTNFNSLSIPSLGSYNFSHPDLLIFNTSGLQTLEVSISNVNGMTNDFNSGNDSLYFQIEAVDYATLGNREYIYYHASSAPPNCPLVLVCHGYSGTAQGIMDYSQFNALAEEFGFAVCYPQGTLDGSNTTFFNVGYDFQNNQTVDDVAFVEELIDSLQAMYSLSEQDVFCTGMSNGGDFSYMLACQASETFKAVAPVAGMIMQDIMDDCNPVNEVSILEIHGTQDNVTYWQGDPNNNDGWGAYPSIPNTIDFFTNMFGLTALSSAVFPDIDPTDGSVVNSDKYSQFGSCTQVWLYTVNGGGHDWPGSDGNMDISASREAWVFFQQLCDVPVKVPEYNVSKDRQLIRIVDILGRETEFKKGVLLFYQYSDGSIVKEVVVD
uniref:Phospholipase/carboxylesterase n=1 Tax=uncultured Cytophagia bacterium TaxID=768505 RepID=H6REA0_9BACT|nr:LpqC [uncultured bacterium]CCF99361.1 phospholipase/carboxylesterase [uncultured Cytophagia bacterium]